MKKQSDYNYTTSGVIIWVYIANKEQYTYEIENIRAEFLEQGNISDNMWILTWLLEECDILYIAFSKLERSDVRKRM